MVYQDLGEYEKAAGLLELALSSDLKNFGEDQPTSANKKLNLARVYLSLDRKEEARLLFQQAYNTFYIIWGQKIQIQRSPKNG